MLLILSQSCHEPTTEEVMDWLEALAVPCVRLNGDDLDGEAALAFDLDGAEWAGWQLRLAGDGLGGGPAGASSATDTRADGGPAASAATALALADVEVVWFRRWLYERRGLTAPLLAGVPGEADGASRAPGDLDGSLQPHLALRDHLNLELRKLSDLLWSRLSGARWLTRPESTNPNKLLVLERAARAGLRVPATLVTGSRAELARFAERHGPLITKPIGETTTLHFGGQCHSLYTAPLDAAEIARLPASFPPSLFQERLAKRYELRVFYLDGACHAMAIFSQADAQTREDFRHYNLTRPVRTVPYSLAPATTAAVVALMRDLGLPTGSLDLVRTVDGEDVFLEVNVVGQFGMVSQPCNYHLELKVAEILKRMVEDGYQPG